MDVGPGAAGARAVFDGLVPNTKYALQIVFTSEVGVSEPRNVFVRPDAALLMWRGVVWCGVVWWKVLDKRSLARSPLFLLFIASRRRALPPDRPTPRIAPTLSVGLPSS